LVRAAKRRIFVIATDSAGCWWYRLRLPLMALNPDEFDVIWEPPFNNWRPGDIVIGQRIAGHNAAWLEMCAEPGLTTVYDIDDNLLEIDPANTVPYQIFSPIVQDTAANIAAAQVVTVSTPRLAERLASLNPNCVVLPNCLHPSWLARIEFPHDDIVVGWAGSPFHNQDFRGVPEQLLDYSRREPRARFHMIGGDPTAGLVPRSVSGFTDMQTYWNNLDFDIGTVFLSDNEQNRCKSWIKVLEYAGRGIVPVAPRIGQYPEFIEHGVNGFLYNGISELTHYLLTLSDNQQRSTMSNAAMSAATEYTIDRQVSRWEAVYREA
jgi:glycosyltransferase involved in cell wall biosynthesis